uniref:Uncharacterized protein n=1 Tax=Ascaris lumbricoides TaxID=6252 RepID=A0A0M3IHG0_ASCLU
MTQQRFKRKNYGNTKHLQKTKIKNIDTVLFITSKCSFFAFAQTHRKLVRSVEVHDEFHDCMNNKWEVEVLCNPLSVRKKYLMRIYKRKRLKVLRM